jgi:hypothetical protein
MAEGSAKTENLEGESKIVLREAPTLGERVVKISSFYRNIVRSSRSRNIHRG